jgi:DNA adenine methylase
MIAETTIKRPALRYYGGKWNLAPWIISHFPPHKNYVEPCGGAASVLLQKPRSPLETYNDLDGNVVNFFRVLRDRPDELIRKIRLTPWAREEYRNHYEPAPDDEVERARRFWVGSVFGISGMPFSSSGMRMVKNTDHAPNGLLPWMVIDVSFLEIIARRLRMVQIESKQFDQFVREYDHVDALIYFDPPYVHSERTNISEYVFEWNDSQHIESAELMRACSGFVVVSGYACPLYAELYEAHGWQRVDKEAQTNSGGKRIESLWLSPRTVEALNMPRQAALL